MLGELFVAGFIAASGFVTAGVFGSFYHLVTGEPARFFGEMNGPVSGLVLLIMWLFAGPFIFMRNAIQNYYREMFSPKMLAAAGGLATMWSICSGTIVLGIILVL
ncbi:hypothetical protein PsAD2_00543 [Pseudovibrio axinellae]|uniref:Uncharacterized protein n=1 Tax=Pseudovibrio axinellae TaxID=989403 RepID=A0A161XH71_9HYPH|nr:hypothetical protein [Pseudovibrio axinellae]KZL21253.1 hypothetical protein PsAD2_00543 [Pseudovibrio axinellae]SEQ93628.1 hypothetical protein SAMN05421798_105166 [Pseudovibrio axinellae]